MHAGSPCMPGPLCPTCGVTHQDDPGWVAAIVCDVVLAEDANVHCTDHKPNQPAL